MGMITIYGASDDLIEVDGCEGADEFNSYAVGPWMGHIDLVSAQTGESMRVHCIYDGCWSFAVGQRDDGACLPAWSVSVDPSAEVHYSTRLTITAPPDTVCEFKEANRE